VSTRFRLLFQRDKARARAVALLGPTVAAGALLALVAASDAPRRAPAPSPAPPAKVRLTSSVPAPEPEAELIRLQDLDADAARLWNAASPVSALPNPPARPFRLEAQGVLDETRAVDCMTAAIYYEAAYESADGQRAVAQVVLNRLRHPAFPKTVCGVVFQGSTRPTGCQFTFTCDGALARRPDEAGWSRARRVAEAALRGQVMPRVGNATHYHADYVAPYWSPSLVKVAAIGAHVFYRWTGVAGLPPAFAGRYAGGEAAGLQVAAVDRLGGALADLGLAASAEATVSDVAAVVEDIPVEPAAPAAPEVEAELITPAAVAPEAETMIPAEDLDWLGEPKVRQPPRLPMPSRF
jgi:hypothetical protein